MPGLLVAVLLIASLLLVHFSLRSRPMPKERPLNVDEGLPLPEAGQASTVFSLTALFGAYFGIALLLGLPALLGLACGTVMGLLLIKSWMDRRQPAAFEDYLGEVFDGKNGNASVYALVVSATQCAYVTSELLILREVARILLGSRSEQATFVAIGAGIIGYFYVLFGGYTAVFRTDVLQFVLVATMTAFLGASLIGRNVLPALGNQLLPRSGYWDSPLSGSPMLRYAYHFVIASVMGLGLLAASPDAWKRVFLITQKTGQSSRRFFVFIAVGTAPYLVLLPFVLMAGAIPDGEVDTRLMFVHVVTSNTLFVVASLGLIASFLSAFNGALLASVHVGLVAGRKEDQGSTELSRYHWLMVAAIVTSFLLFKALAGLGNPYLLANLLLGSFALVAGVQVGTKGSVVHMPQNSLLWVFVLGFVGWFAFFIRAVSLQGLPSTYQINTVPGAVFLFLITSVSSWLLLKRGKTNVRS